MRTRKLGTTDLELTTVGLGTWAIGGPWEYGWGPQDDAHSAAAIRDALESGSNWIETAPAYGCGHAEEIEARWADAIVVQSAEFSERQAAEGDMPRKRAYGPTRREPEAADGGRSTVPDALADPEADIEEAWETMARPREEARCGTSACRIQSAAVEDCDDRAAGGVLQPPYSMISRPVA